MIKYLSEKILRYRLARQERTRKKQFIPWDNIGKIALIISSQDKAARSAIDKFTGESRKFIEVFYVEINKRKPTYHDWQCFYKKHASVLRLPKKIIAKELEKQHFDIVINTCTDTDVFSRSLSGFLSAPLKCATTGFSEVDLVIERPDNYKLMNYLDEVVKYLKMIKR